MKFKLPKVEYTTLFSIASSIKAPAESKVTAAALIEKIQKEVQKESQEPEEITIELEQYELANLLLAFVELVKADDTKPQDINILRLLARSLRFSGGFKKELDKLMKTETTIELDPAIDLELDPE